MNKHLRHVSLGLASAALLAGGAQIADAAPAESPSALVLRVLNASNPTAAFRALTSAQKKTFSQEFNDNSIATASVTTPQPDMPLVQTYACTNYTAYASAQGSRTYLGVTAYRYYLDVKYVYDCNSVNSISITGATGTPSAPFVSYKGVSAKTNVVVAPNRARSKAQYNFSFSGPYGDTSSCLGINVTVTSAARTVSADNSCSANP